MVRYQNRPWITSYDAGLPADIAVEARDIPQIWRASVERAPNLAFIRYFDSTHTFSEVDADSDSLAVALAERGIGRNDRVALYLQNVPQFVIGILAAWKVGGIAVPVNPMMKEHELGYIVGDSGAKALICLQELWSSVASKVVEKSPIEMSVTTSPLDYLEEAVPKPLRSVQRIQTPGADDFLALIRGHAGRRPKPVTLSPDSLAVLTYTSGTTGDPKAAMNTHKNVVFSAQVYRDWNGLTDEDVCLAAAPLFHVTGLIGHVAVAMLTGMPLVLGYRFDPSTMSELAERYRATFTILAITGYTAMMSDPSVRERDLSSLSKVFSCGAPVAPSIVEDFERDVGPYIHNTYGLTETTASSHAVPYGRRAPVDPGTGALSIGVPIFNTVSRIVDENGDDVPVGELGEIAIKGPGVSPGYWHKPEASATALPGGEMRTGDIGFMDQQGWFYVVDRTKDVINCAGYKVWPREVEDVLVKHPAVREAGVVGVPDEYRGESVKAFVSLQPDTDATPDELIRFCKENLAAYKYPRQIEIVDELPKTQTGKILRRKLRKH